MAFAFSGSQGEATGFTAVPYPHVPGRLVLILAWNGTDALVQALGRGGQMITPKLQPRPVAVAEIGALGQ